MIPSSRRNICPVRKMSERSERIKYNIIKILKGRSEHAKTYEN